MKQLRSILIPELLQDWYVGTFYKCKKCNGKLDLKHEGATKIKNEYPLIGGWYHVNCAIIRDKPQKKGLFPI